MITAEGFQRTFDILAYVGLPEHRMHDVGNVYLTVTDQGSVGYLNDQRIEGSGMGVAGQPSSLFIASLWGGTDANYICNNGLTAEGLDAREWEADDRVAAVDRPDGAQAFCASFTDGGARRAARYRRRPVVLGLRAGAAQRLRALLEQDRP